MNDRSNPLFVYEIRQVVRDTMALGYLCLHVVGLVLITGLHLYEAIESGRIVMPNDHHGGALAVKILAMLHCSCLGFLVAYSFNITKNQGLDDELLFTTCLDGKKALSGKLQVVTLVTGLFYAVALPFLTVAWLLRGVDLVAVFVTMAVMFVVTQIVVLYVAGAFIRCRTTTDVVASFFALLIGSPPMLALVFGGPSLVGGFALGGGLGAYLFAAVPLIGIALAILSWVVYQFTKEMYVMNWAYLPAERRFGIIMVYSWFTGYVVLMIGITASALIYFALALF